MSVPHAITKFQASLNSLLFRSYSRGSELISMKLTISQPWIGMSEREDDIKKEPFGARRSPISSILSLRFSLFWRNREREIRGRGPVLSLALHLDNHKAVSSDFTADVKRSFLLSNFETEVEEILHPVRGDSVGRLEFAQLDAQESTQPRPEMVGEGAFPRILNYSAPL